MKPPGIQQGKKRKGICELLETLHDIIVDERFCVREFTVSDIDAVWTLREMPNRQTMRNPDNRK